MNNEQDQDQSDTTRQEEQAENPKRQNENGEGQNAQPALVDTAAKKVLKDILTRIL